MMQIHWDGKKCTSPRECRMCLEECPPGIFAIYPKDGRKPGIATKNWAVRPLLLSLCTGCNICEEVCPQGAIAVSAS